MDRRSTAPLAPPRFQRAPSFVARRACGPTSGLGVRVEGSGPHLETASLHAIVANGWLCSTEFRPTSALQGWALSLKRLVHASPSLPPFPPSLPLSLPSLPPSLPWKPRLQLAALCSSRQPASRTLPRHSMRPSARWIYLAPTACIWAHRQNALPLRATACEVCREGRQKSRAMRSSCHLEGERGRGGEGEREAQKGGGAACVCEGE